MPTPVTTAFVCHLGLNFQDWGREESYWLKARTWDQAAIDCLRIAQARRVVMGEGVEIMWAGVRTWGYPSYEQGFLQGTLQALKLSNGDPFWEPPQTYLQTVCVQFKAEPPHYLTRHFCFVPRGEIQNNRWVRERREVPAVTPTMPLAPGPADKQRIWDHAIGTIRDLTFHGKVLDDLVGGVHQVELRDWEDVYYSCKSAQPVKSKLYRMSAEAGDYLYTPHIGFCGRVVGIRRRGYERACRWYTNGLIHSIRYYRSRPGALLLPFPTCFHGCYGEAGYLNTGGPGELSGAPIVPWTPGFSWSNAPGTGGPIGGPNAFLGQAVCPYDDSSVTPLILRPACDMPTPIIRADLDDDSVIDPNVVRVSFESDDFDLVDVAPGHVLVSAKFSFGVGLSDASLDYSPVSELQFQPDDGFTLDAPTAGTVIVKRAALPAPDVVSVNQNNFPTANLRTVVLAPTVDINVTGFADHYPGKELRVWNDSTKQITFTDGDTNSAVGNRLNLNGCPLFTIAAGMFAEFVYDDFANVWVLMTQFGFSDVWTGGVYGNHVRLMQGANPPRSLTFQKSNLIESETAIAVINKSFKVSGFVLLDADWPAADLLSCATGNITACWSASGQTIRGIDVFPGAFLQLVYNAGPGAITIAHRDSGTASINQINCPGAVDLVLSYGQGALIAMFGGDNTGFTVLAFSS